MQDIREPGLHAGPAGIPVPGVRTEAWQARYAGAGWSPPGEAAALLHAPAPGEKGPLPTLLGFLGEQRELGRPPLVLLWGDWDFYLLGCGMGGWSNRHMGPASASRAMRKPRDGGEGLPATTLALKQHLWRMCYGLETT